MQLTFLSKEKWERRIKIKFNSFTVVSNPTLAHGSDWTISTSRNSIKDPSEWTEARTLQWLHRGRSSSDTYESMPNAYTAKILFIFAKHSFRTGYKYS